MLFLNKLLPVFVLPLGWVVLLLLYALFRRKRWPVAAGLVLLYVASLPVTGGRLIARLESGYPAVPVASAPPADAVVVLGGVLGPKAPPGYVTNWDDSSERFDGGVALWKAGRAPWLIFTGARLPWAGPVTLEGVDLRAIAIRQGVPAEQILVTPEVGNTRDEARAVAEMAKVRGWHNVLVVTTAWHMPRAAQAFRHAGVMFTAFPVDFRVEPGHPLTPLDFLPRAEALAQTETALREFYGFAFYALTGR